MKLTMRKSGWLDDWYVIERMFPFERSARISDADVEGTAEEMIELAGAILSRAKSSGGRCAVLIDGDRAFFWSPRNSRSWGEVPYSDAEELAREIIGQLNQGGEPKGESP